MMTTALEGLAGGAELIIGILGGSALLGLIKLVDVWKGWRMGARTIERDVLADAEAARARAEERVTVAEQQAEDAVRRAWRATDRYHLLRQLYLDQGGDPAALARLEALPPEPH